MVVFSAVMSLIAAGCLLLGLSILRIDTNNRLNRLFAFVCFIVSLWHIAAVIGYSSTSHGVIITATVFASFICLAFISANLHVGMVLTLKKKPPRFVTVLLYGPAFAFTAFIAVAPYMFFTYARHGGA